MGKQCLHWHREQMFSQRASWPLLQEGQPASLIPSAALRRLRRPRCSSTCQMFHALPTEARLSPGGRVPVAWALQVGPRRSQRAYGEVQPS